MSSNSALMDRPRAIQADGWIEVVVDPRPVPEDVIDSFFAWVVPASKQVEDGKSPAWSVPEH